MKISGSDKNSTLSPTPQLTSDPTIISNENLEAQSQKCGRKKKLPTDSPQSEKSRPNTRSRAT